MEQNDKNANWESRGVSETEKEEELPQMEQGNIYEAESADKLVSDLFTGQLTVEQALQKLRTRLLDLSSRNRLVNYRHPKGRSLQFVGEPNLNLVFNRLIDGKPLQIKYVPDPSPDTYTLKRPEAKLHAQSMGIDANYEFTPSSCGSTANKHTPKLQAFYYPVDLDKLCRKVSSEARTIIEETGTNMLYLVFGFLEFYEREESEKPMLAPLLAVPVGLEKGAVDLETRTYQYSINYSGEDVHENQTLREKLNQDFSLQLPEFEEEDEPGSYFGKITKAVEKRKRWTVRYQLTLGFLSFGKLAIWDDLDPAKWPGLLKHPLLHEVFSGGASSKGASLFPEDYEIDKHPQAELPLIYDADSSQHSAIIDVLSGKNMVINGPPGTGKSQTITNVIAAGLRQGKKILFVSEKLAALEVVRHRLNHANLGHFCLELHSHKTQKKKLLADLQERLDEQFRPPQQLQDKVSTLKRHRQELNRYAELMASRVGNELGLTVHEIVWRTERRRQAVGALANVVQSLFLSGATKWLYDDIEHRRAKLDALGQLYIAIGSFDSSHPWWGFTPQLLAPGDDESIGRIILEAKQRAEALFESVLEYQERSNSNEPSLENIERTHNALHELPEPPPNLCSELLPRLFSQQDSQGKQSYELLTSIIRKVNRARQLNAKADGLLSAGGCELTYEQAETVVAECSKELAAAAFSARIEDFGMSVADAEQAFNEFRQISSEVPAFFAAMKQSLLDNLDTKLRSTAPLELVEQPINYIKEGVEAVSREVTRLKQSLEKVMAISNRRGIAFDGSPTAIAQLGHPDGIEDIRPGVAVDKAVITIAQKAADYILSDLSLAELDKRQHTLHALHDRLSRMLEELTAYAEQLGVPFDVSPRTVNHLNVLAQVASQAPADLLDYRRPSFGHPRVNELLNNAEKAHRAEASEREALSQEFYLDMLPSIDELKAAIRAFRRGDRFFNFLNREWRLAKKLFKSIGKTKTKRKAADYEAKVAGIVAWVEHRSAFLGNEEFKETFGTLFTGLETDFSKIRRLHNWYSDSRTEMLKYPGLIDVVDLSGFESTKLNQLAVLASRIQAISTELKSCLGEVRNELGSVAGQLEATLKQTGWSEYNQKILKVAEGLKNVSLLIGRYVKPEVSPKRAVEVLKAKLELLGAKEAFDALNHGLEAIHRASEPLLPGITSIPCNHWDEYLEQLNDLANRAMSICTFLEEYVPNEVTPQSARAFIQAKITLDGSLQKFANLPDRSVTSDWASYVTMVSTRINAARRVFELLRPAAANGKTSQEVIVGLRARKEATGLIDELSADTAVTSLLQDLFQGAETDVDALEKTVAWGQVVGGNKTVRASALNDLLLCKGAAENFRWAQALLVKVLELRADVQDKLNELNEFGSFSWDEWNSAAQALNEHRPEFASDLFARVEVASTDIDAVLPWSKYNAERRDCMNMGVKDFVVGLEQKRLPPASTGAVFEFVVYRSIGRSIYQSFPELEGFAGAKHEKKRSEFVALDQEIISLTGKSFAYEIDKAKKVPDGESGYRAAERTEMQLLWRELGKQRRHLPIRQLIKRAGRAIQALKPCFMMGPMSVAQYLEQGAVGFDMIVMDEASQLRPEEALGAIARGEQLVVVGDPKQLPPTNFFDRMVDGGDEDEDDDTPAVLAGSESILDICQQLFHPVRTLRWHYRSQHESLIAFSNHHFYSGKLVVFPSPFERNNRLGLRYRYIRNGVYQNRQNGPEAQCVVDAIIEHMMKHPHESLGVVTLNQTQRDLIEDLLDKKLRNIEEGEEFVAKWEEDGWPFFVKNLENVQGDERDVIFISTTFGKSPETDKVRQNFGPISRPDGWRRLNVLFTRARRKIDLFTSMLPEDIIVEAKTPAGTRALKDYLDFAKRGVLSTTDITGREPDSDFEVAVGDMLRNRGYEIVPQLGVAGFFIDLAVRNPDRPGEFLAAVECDGATYHSSNSARDRDRIRQVILESLGWRDRIWRVWSTDWFYDPRRESERLLAFLEKRRQEVRAQPTPDYNFGEDIEPENVKQEAQEVVAEPEHSGITFSDDDVFVEVGDRVTYCFTNEPDTRRTVMIVDTDSNPRLNLVNENTPVAQALLGMSVGDEQKFEVHGASTRTLRILKIQRQEELAL